MHGSIKVIDSKQARIRARQFQIATVVCVIAGVMTLTFSPRSAAGFSDFFSKYLGGDEKSDRAIPGSLTESEMIDGLKEALSVGVERAIALLGQDGGFLNDDSVRISMPSALTSIEKGLRAIKQDKYADQFIGTINHAAEKAIPRASTIFAEAVRNLSLVDAQSILSGPDDAATAFFRRNTESQLNESMYPIIQTATSETGVTSSYKNFTSKARILGQFIDKENLDLDKYITSKALDGLFTKLALEEAKIRQDPLARSSNLLQKVFDSFNKYLAGQSSG